MRAVVHRSYGGPEVLQLDDVPRPTPGPGDVLIAVRATSINEWDAGRMRGRPFANRAMFGLRRPRSQHRIPGCDVGGNVEQVGVDVERLRVGDEVFGDLSGSGAGGFAEYARAPATVLAAKPSTMSFVQAAAVPQAGLLALRGLRASGVGAGQRLLVIGAGGGLGTFAIPIARSRGAHVTAVDVASKFDTMRAVGADEVVDHTVQDVTRSAAAYDVIVDVMARHGPADYRRMLTDDGRCIVLGGATSVIARPRSADGSAARRCAC